MSATVSPGATRDLGHPPRPSRLSTLVRAWHAVLSHGEPADLAAWERNAWDEYVTALRAEASIWRVLLEVGRSTVEHIRHRLLEGAPTALPAGVLMFLGFVLTVLDPAALRPEHYHVLVAMAWSSFLFLRWPSAFPRWAVAISGGVWTTAMIHRLSVGDDLDSVSQLDGIADWSLLTGHIVILAGNALLAWSTVARHATDLTAPWLVVAAGVTLVSLANIGWSQVTMDAVQVIVCLLGGGVAALFGTSLYRIRKVPVVG